jgi:uncharacterized membrane protein
VSAITTQHRVPANARPLHPAAGAMVIWAISAALVITILAAIIGAPLLQSSGHSAFAFKIYRVFSFLCHQIPERSFHIAGHQFAVCSRCTGLYAGFALAILSFPVFRSLQKTETPRIVWLFASAMPLAIDFSLTYFGIWQNNHFTRFTTGALFGAVAAIFILPGVIELGVRLHQRLIGRELKKDMSATPH